MTAPLLSRRPSPGMFRKLRRRYEQLRKSLDTRARSRHRLVLISYPKSGRTWIRFMLDAAGVRIRYDHAGSENRLALPVEEIAGRTEEWRDWRIVFLHRDPRDTVVSCYFQATRRVKEKYAFHGTIAEFMRDPRYGIEKIARFNLHWLESADRFRDYLSLSYEGLHQSTKPELGRVIRFITGRQPREALLERVVSRGRFDNMRAVETRQNGGRIDESTRLGGGRGSDENALKTRRGKVGGWTDYFTEEEAAYMDGVLARLDYWDRIARTTSEAA